MKKQSQNSLEVAVDIHDSCSKSLYFFIDSKLVHALTANIPTLEMQLLTDLKIKEQEQKQYEKKQHIQKRDERTLERAEKNYNIFLERQNEFLLNPTKDQQTVLKRYEERTKVPKTTLLRQRIVTPKELLENQQEKLDKEYLGFQRKTRGKSISQLNAVEKKERQELLEQERELQRLEQKYQNIIHTFNTSIKDQSETISNIKLELERIQQEQKKNLEQMEGLAPNVFYAEPLGQVPDTLERKAVSHHRFVNLLKTFSEFVPASIDALLEPYAQTSQRKKTPSKQTELRELPDTILILDKQYIIYGSPLNFGTQYRKSQDIFLEEGILSTAANKSQNNRIEYHGVILQNGNYSLLENTKINVKNNARILTDYAAMLELAEEQQLPGQLVRVISKDIRATYDSTHKLYVRALNLEPEKKQDLQGKYRKPKDKTRRDTLSDHTDIALNAEDIWGNY